MANINKNEIGYNENTTANALMVQYKRGLAAPMDISEVFTSLTSAQQYAKKDPIAYAGQTIAVAGEGIKTEVYKITSGGTLVRLVDENDIKNLSGGTNNITTVTPDWNAQEGEDGYIENRTHYHGSPIEENTYDETYLAWGDIREIYPYGFKYYKVTIDGESQIIDFVGKGWPQFDFEKDVQNKYEYHLQFNRDVGLNVSFFENGGYERMIVVEYNPMDSAAPETIDVSITDYSVDFKQLDEKFIPNTIARKTELTELSEKVDTLSGITPDWLASEGEGEPGHIKNRTHGLDWPLCVLNKENTSAHIGGFGEVYVAFNGGVKMLEYGKSLSMGINLIRLEYNDYTVSLVEDEPGLINDFINYDIRIFGVVSKLNDIYLPDTVLKTTPNGDVYITGIGGFDGANYDNAKSVQETIKELTETVKKLNDIITQITITE